VHIGYGEEVVEYRGWLYTEHDPPRCEVHVDIPSHPVFRDGSPWSMWVVGNDMDNAIKKDSYMALTGHHEHAYLALPDSGPL
jgi:hypothetical protein